MRKGWRAGTSASSFTVWLTMRREVLCFALLTLVATAALAPAACTFGDGETKAKSAAAVTTDVKTPPNAFNRTCETSVYGALDAPAWKKHSIIAGPLVFYYADQFASQAPSPGRNGYYPGQKLLILVRRGTAATVVVPEQSDGTRAFSTTRLPGTTATRTSSRTEGLP